jgi:hypothetical protein
MNKNEEMGKLSDLYKERGNILETIRVLNKSLSDAKLRLQKNELEITDLETKLNPYDEG